MYRGKADMAHLSQEDGPSEKHAGLTKGEEGQQVHPFVFSLLQQGMDPAVVPTHASQGLHVAQHAPHHPRDSCMHFDGVTHTSQQQVTLPVYHYQQVSVEAT